MKHLHRHSLLAAGSLAVALAGVTPDLLAETDKSQAPTQASPSGYGMGPGMMGGYGMGPGMMGGYGMGPGMMMGGPGMMGGCGMGPGMMMGGPGMMGGYWGSQLGLSDEQQAKINRIQDETRKKHWALMDAMMDQQARLRDLYAASKRDNAAIDAAHKDFGKLQQQMYETGVDAHKRCEAVLTKEQQEKLRSYWRRGGGPGY